jgi:hypothetical protein
MHEFLVQLAGQRLDPLNQLLGKFGQVGIPLQQLQQLCVSNSARPFAVSRERVA